MNLTKHILIWGILIPFISLAAWIFSAHTIVDFINTLFIVSMAGVIIFFFLILVQEGVFDATSYGFRRLKYQLSSAKHKKSVEEDEFLNPKSPKRDVYFVQSWTKVAILCSLFYAIVSFTVSLFFIS